MPEITLTTVPGADDILIDGVSLNDIDSFRAQCLTGGSVSCSWDMLHTRLIEHDVSTFWWLLDEAERRSIAEKAIKNIMFYSIKRSGIGEYGCIGGVDEWDPAVCVHNMVIRHVKFGSMGRDQYTDLTNCYWKHLDESTDEICYVPEHSYGLPCNSISVPGHTMCGLQVVNSLDSIDNWIVFQYSDFDIKHGNWQMPVGCSVSVSEVTNLQKGGYNSTGLVGFSP